MRLARAAGLSVVALLLTMAGWATAGTPHRDRCAPKGSVTVKANAKVRVYRDRRHLHDARVIACHRPTGTRTLLGSAIGDTLHEFGGARALALRGSLVAYLMVDDPDSDSEGTGIPPTSVLIKVRLPRTGKAYGTATSTFGFNLSLPPDRPDLAAERIFIAPNGTVLLAVCPAKDIFQTFRGCRRPPGVVRIIAVTAADFARFDLVPPPLARGRRIDPRSLRLSPSGRHVAWTDDGHRVQTRVP